MGWTRVCVPTTRRRQAVEGRSGPNDTRLNGICGGNHGNHCFGLKLGDWSDLP